MFNFHIGLPRLFPELLHSVCASPSLEQYSDVCVLPQEIYRGTLRSLVNADGKQIQMDVNNRRASVDLIGSLAVNRNIAISQHAVLGTPSEIMTSQAAVKRGAKRVERLSELFNGRALTIHLIIVAQVDYLFETMGSGATDAVSALSAPSWSTLVRDLKTAAPNREFVVWDFERPSNAALAFVLAMLDLTEPKFIDEVRRLISAELKFAPRVELRQEPRGLSDAALRLDELYDLDLHSIGKMEGVTLVRSNEVPSEFRL